jgi:hypothetical protein
MRLGSAGVYLALFVSAGASLCGLADSKMTKKTHTVITGGPPNMVPDEEQEESVYTKGGMRRRDSVDSRAATIAFGLTTATAE